MHEIKVPKAGQSVEEVEIVQWLKQEGEAVREGEPLFTIQTDKAEIEVESTADGILRKQLVPEGAEVPVLTVAALVGEADEPLPAELPGTAAVQAAAASPSPSPAAAPVEAVASAASVSSTAAMPAQTHASAGRTFASPRARRTAAEHHVDPERLAGSGPGGRVIAADVQAYAAILHDASMSPVARRLAGAAGLDPAAIPGSGVRGKIMKADVANAAKDVQAKKAAAPTSGAVRRVPLSKMRSIIARRMSASKFEAPHYYVTVEVDMARAVAFRSGLARFKASYNDLVLYAVRSALLEFPQVNARWAGDAIEEVPEVHLGMAVALPAGLVVPVIRDAHALSLEGLCALTRELGERARTGKLTPDDYQGNTFTVSNLGVYGVDHFTAIINQPDSAIVAVGQMKDRVVASDGGIHVRPIMKLTMSSDHRVIDGAVAAQFMGRVREILESADF